MTKCVMKPSSLGNVSLSPKAGLVIDDADVTLNSLLDRHRKGDWGSVSPDEEGMNINAINDGEGVVLSQYAYNYEVVFVRTCLSPFKKERYTEVLTGWEMN